MPNLEVLDISDNFIEDEGIRWTEFLCMCSWARYSQILTCCLWNFRSLIPYFVEASEGCSSLADLNLEKCDLSCNAVTELLNALSTFKGPLKSLSLADNFLGRFVLVDTRIELMLYHWFFFFINVLLVLLSSSQVAVALGKFLHSSIQVLNIGGIELGSFGFKELQEGMTEELKLVKINIRFELIPM